MLDESKTIELFCSKCWFSPQAYYAVFLNGGRLEVHISNGVRDPRRITIKPESGEFHDGREHSIWIERLKG